jgi:hypothetical protein
MKKHILTFLVVIAAITAKAQGNLQFNRVVNFTPGNSYTVPVGKVIKIESIAYNGTNVCLPFLSSYAGACCPVGYSCGNTTLGNYSSVDYLVIGDLIFSTGNISAYCSIPLPTCAPKTVTPPTITLPFWLPAGKTISIYSNTFPMVISAIEFNIIP